MTSASNPTDTGLFGPDSVTWRIHLDPAMWIAAFSALALQSLHPRTMWATYQNSALFRRRSALARLYRTVDYVATRTFGATTEVEQAGQRVRGIHAALTGTDEETGQRFRIDEEEYLLWVHCAEIYPYLRVARASGIRLTDADADTYIHEQRRAAAVVGLDPQRVPASVAEMEAYFRRIRPWLRLTATARRGILMWVNTPAPPRLTALRLAYPYLGGLGIALLPGWARRIYGLPGTGTAGRAVDTGARHAARATRRTMLLLPERYTGTREQIRRIRAAEQLMNRPRHPDPHRT